MHLILIFLVLSILFNFTGVVFPSYYKNKQELMKIVFILTLFVIVYFYLLINGDFQLFEYLKLDIIEFFKIFILNSILFSYVILQKYYLG